MELQKKSSNIDVLGAGCVTNPVPAVRRYIIGLKTSPCAPSTVPTSCPHSNVQRLVLVGCSPPLEVPQVLTLRPSSHQAYPFPHHQTCCSKTCPVPTCTSLSHFVPPPTNPVVVFFSMLLWPPMHATACPQLSVVYVVCPKTSNGKLEPLRDLVPVSSELA